MENLRAMKVIASSEMARVEKLSMDEGASSKEYMLKAGLGISEKLQSYIDKKKLDKQVTLLVGKGNNGGDAYVVGCDLLKKGYKVLALYLYNAKECSELNALHFENFTKCGGEANHLKSKEDFTPLKGGVILDGLLGTGFSGETKDQLKLAIDLANECENPKVAIDIPSGIDGNTGQVIGSCIKADLTIFLGQPKIGFFINDGYNFVGDLVRVDFGMDKKYISKMQEIAYLFKEKSAPSLLPEILRTQHKYESGYVVALAGSKGMAGAAKLSCLASLRSGAGIVRLFYPKEMELELVDSFSELIKSPWTKDDLAKLFEEEKRAKALLIGPGLGKSEDAMFVAQKLIETSNVKTIIDADGIDVFTKKAKNRPKDVVLTPHKAEFLRCIDADKNLDDVEIIKRAEDFVNKEDVTLVLKGAPTFVFHPKEKPIIFPFGDPGMATAGSGDVLSGVVAAFLAHGLNPMQAACLSVYIHAKAGELAAKDKTSYSLIASDIIEYIPKILNLLKCELVEDD